MYRLTEEQTQFLTNTFYALWSKNLGLAIVGDYTSMEGVERQIDRINSGEVKFTEPVVFYMTTVTDKSNEDCPRTRYVIEKLTLSDRQEKCS